MAVTEYLVRDCTPQVNTGTVDTPVWLDIRAHLSDWSGSGSANNADTTTFEDEGWTSQMAASRGITWELNGKAQEDPDTGDRDAGQLYVEAWAMSIGSDSRKQFRILTPAGEVLWQFMATANLSNPGGGGSDDASGWGVSLTSSGIVTGLATLSVALPIAPGTLVATGLNDAITAEWAAPVGAVGVTVYEWSVETSVGGVVAATGQTTTRAAFINGLANVTAYKFKVRAHNAAGWGPFSALSTAATTT